MGTAPNSDNLFGYERCLNLSEVRDYTYEIMGNYDWDWELCPNANTTMALVQRFMF